MHVRSAIILMLWAGFAATAGIVDTFRPRPGVSILAPIVPAIGVVAAYRASGAVRAGVDRISGPALVRVQMVRVVGLAFLLYAIAGRLPMWWALPVAIWDLLVGIAAPVIAARLRRRKPGARQAAVAFNLFGLSDFAFAIPAATFALPGALGPGADGPSMLALVRFPLILITGVGVPLAIGAHLASLARLRSRHTQFAGAVHG